jgi:hypothetical protein
MLKTNREYIERSRRDGGYFAEMIDDYSKATPDERTAFMNALTEDDKGNFAYNVLLLVNNPLSRIGIALGNFQDEFTLFTHDLANLLCG